MRPWLRRHSRKILVTCTLLLAVLAVLFVQSCFRAKGFTIHWSEYSATKVTSVWGTLSISTRTRSAEHRWMTSGAGGPAQGYWRSREIPLLLRVVDSEGSQLLPDRTTVYSAERDVSFTYVGCAAILSFVLIFVTVLKWRHRKGASPGFDVAPS